MYRIFVEGKEDEFFIKYCVETLVPTLNGGFEIISIGGWTQLPLFKNLFQENTDRGGRNIIIFDADHPANGGGYQNRLNAINGILKKQGIASDVFLFPDNASDGDLEVLIEKVSHEDHKIVFDSFDKYEESLNAADYEYSLPSRKARIFAYLDAFKNSKSEFDKVKKGDYLYHKQDRWQFLYDRIPSLVDYLRQL